MPYYVKQLPNGKWGKFKKEDNKLVSHHDTKEKADASIAAYYANKKNEEVNKITKYKYNPIMWDYTDPKVIVGDPIKTGAIVTIIKSKIIN